VLILISSVQHTKNKLRIVLTSKFTDKIIQDLFGIFTIFRVCQSNNLGLRITM